MGKFVRFLIVGASGTVLDFVLLIVFKEAFHLATLIANVMSYSCSIVNNFTWNRLWTFPEARDKHIAMQFVQFAGVSLIGLTLNTAIVLLLETPLGDLLHDPENGYLPAKVIATVCVVMWNFLANRFWTFRS